MNKNRREAIVTLTGVAVMPIVTAGALVRVAAAQQSAQLSPQEARAIAKEVFLWGMHPVAIYHLRYNQTQNDESPTFSGVNRLHWSRTPMKALPRIATTPNATTLYGFAQLDLSKEPVVVAVPEIKEHYWSVQLHDNYARWWHLIGSQFNAPGPVRRLLIGPNWSGKLPAGFVGADIVQSTSDFAGVLARVALTDDAAEELRIVNGIQDGITIMSLGQWVAAGQKEVRAEDVPLTRGNYPTYPGMEAVKEPGKLSGIDFMRWVSLVLNDPVFTKQIDGHQEIMAFSRFERLGLKAGQPFDPSKLPTELTTAIDAGIEDGRKDVLALMAKGSGVERNGWGLSSDLGYKDTDWLERARYGLIAVLAPVPSRSHTGAFCLKNSQGRELSGARTAIRSRSISKTRLRLRSFGKFHSTTARGIFTTTPSIAIRSTATCSSVASWIRQTASLLSTCRTMSRRTRTSAKTGCRRRKKASSLPLASTAPARH